MMARMSARSNPTGLQELDRRRVSLTLAETAGRRLVMLERLDLTDTGLADSLKVVLIARAGATTIRHGLGSIADYQKTGNSLDGLDPSQPIRFRILLHEDGNAKLVASVENLRARNDSESESLLPMEPADLGERVWKLAITEDGPVLQFNSRVFPSASGAENYVAFGAMVLPEALRQVMERIAEDPNRLDDESDPWNAWGAWLDAHGIDRPKPDDDDTFKDSWCDQVVDKFCNRCSFASRLLTELQKEGGQ